LLPSSCRSPPRRRGRIWSGRPVCRPTPRSTFHSRAHRRSRPGVGRWRALFPRVRHDLFYCSIFRDDDLCLSAEYFSWRGAQRCASLLALPQTSGRIGIVTRAGDRMFIFLHWFSFEQRICSCRPNVASWYFSSRCALPHHKVERRGRVVISIFCEEFLMCSGHNLMLETIVSVTLS
jgi:hypothetical protein